MKSTPFGWRDAARAAGLAGLVWASVKAAAYVESWILGAINRATVDLTWDEAALRLMAAKGLAILAFCVVVLLVATATPPLRRSMSRSWKSLDPCRFFQFVAGLLTPLVAVGLAQWALGRSPLELLTFPPEFPASILIPWCALAALWIAAKASFEEFLFRGVLRDALQERLGPAVAIGGAALVFGLAHDQPDAQRLLWLTSFGLLTGYLVLRTGSLWPAMGAHVSNNLLAHLYDAQPFGLRLLRMTYDGSTAPTYPSGGAVVALVTSLIVLGEVLAFMRRRSSRAR